MHLSVDHAGQDVQALCSRSPSGGSGLPQATDCGIRPAVTPMSGTPIARPVIGPTVAGV